MRNKVNTIVILAAVLASGTAARAGSYGEPLLDKKSSFSVGVENLVNTILHPLDVATQPVTTLIHPLTGRPTFGQTEPQKVAIQGDAKPANDETEKQKDMKIIGAHER